jgi:hypothetical protein
VAAEATPSAAPPATGRRARAGHKRKTAMTSNPATPTDSPQLTAAAIQAPADTPEAAMARWVGDVGQATPTALAIAAKPKEEVPQPRAQEPARKQRHAPAQISEPWDPLRRIEDVNEIHVAIAVSFAALMFVVGLWSGRRARRAAPAVIAQVDMPAPAPAPAARADAPSTAPELPENLEPEEQVFEAEEPWDEPSPQPAQHDFQTPVAPAPATGTHYDEASFADLTSPGFSPTDDPLALPDAFEGSVPPAPSRREPDTLPSLPPGGLAPKPAVSVEDENQWPEWTAPEPAPAQPAANDNAAARPAAVKEQPKPARKRAAGAARGGIQEEMVVRRRSDARRDD